MGHDHDGPLRASGPFVDRRADALPHGSPRLHAEALGLAPGCPGRELLGPSAADRVSVEPLPPAEVAFHQPVVDGDVQVEGMRKGLGGRVRTGQRRADDEARRVFGQHSSGGLGLAASAVVQRDVQGPLDPAGDIEIRLTVAPQHHAGSAHAVAPLSTAPASAASPCPSGTSRSTDGQSPHSLSKA